MHKLLSDLAFSLWAKTPKRFVLLKCMYVLKFLHILINFTIKTKLSLEQIMQLKDYSSTLNMKFITMSAWKVTAILAFVFGWDASASKWVRDDDFWPPLQVGIFLLLLFLSNRKITLFVFF